MRAGWEEPPAYRSSVELGMPGLTPAVRALILANAAVFGVMFVLSLWEGTAEFVGTMQSWLGITPAHWDFPVLPVWQVVTWGFLHALNNPFHILYNMLGLYFLGTLLEGIVGSKRFLATYFGGLLFSGIVTLATGLLFEPSSEVPTIGASGAIMCIVVAAAVMRPQTRIIFFIVPMTLRTLALIYVGIDVFFLLSQIRFGPSGVAHLAHLAGAGWGFWIARRGWIWIDPLAALRRRQQQMEREREHSDEERLDRLLAKINREGIHSLSARERGFLKRVSKRK